MIDDTLGPGFTVSYLDLGTDPDGEGSIRASLVSYNSDAPGFAERPALLWVHGMTDYFFSDHVARHYDELGYAFYALDLRKCGRSRTEGQTWHYVSDLTYYYEDLNAALDAIPNESVIPIAHSTAGLICSLWLSDTRPAKVTGLILNGPWLDMMSVPKPTFRALAPVIDSIGKRFPMLAIPGGNLTAFGDSMHVSKYGEWNYDLTLKPLGGHTKYIGWLRAVLAGFKRLHSGYIDVHVPYLTLCSTRSILGKPYSEEINYVDAVVDVQQTIRWAPTLGTDCTLRPISGARHEAFASRQPIRDEVFAITDKWLSEHSGS
ncbi:alpha/beta hydrolase [uncultured Corynebacterium sp.]|uniref:alpha/beta hydrolase n=1 Tax=uncultured Corynebacterium sp. TaxID=159447 RepID=UPI0025CBA70F|nr:alpha/beta hydrolase [uncultured Corynebacterium sp.]